MSYMYKIFRLRREKAYPNGNNHIQILIPETYTPGPFYNTVHYSMVLVITRTFHGPQMV